MKTHQFDRLAVTVATRPSRRRVLTGMLAALGGGVWSTQSIPDASAQWCTTTGYPQQYPCCSGYYRADSTNFLCCEVLEGARCSSSYDCCYFDPASPQYNCMNGTCQRVMAAQQPYFPTDPTLQPGAPAPSNSFNTPTDVITELSMHKSRNESIVLQLRDFATMQTVDPAALFQARRLYDAAKAGFDETIDGLVFGLSSGVSVNDMGPYVQYYLQPATQLSTDFQSAADGIMGQVRGGGFIEIFPGLFDSLLGAYDRWYTRRQDERTAITTLLTGLKLTSWDTLWAQQTGATTSQ